MKTFIYWLPFEGRGEDNQAAWEDAMESAVEAIARGRYEKPPEDVFGKDEPIPAAEILGGSLNTGFGYEVPSEEPEDVEEINPHGIPED